MLPRPACAALSVLKTATIVPMARRLTRRPAALISPPSRKRRPSETSCCSISIDRRLTALVWASRLPSDGIIDHGSQTKESGGGCVQDVPGVNPDGFVPQSSAL
jgi:hypothetical protein